MIRLDTSDTLARFVLVFGVRNLTQFTPHLSVLQTEIGRIAVKCKEIQVGPLFAYRRFAMDHPKLKSERPDEASNPTLKTDSSSPDAPYFKRLFGLKEILEKLTWQYYLKMKRGIQRNDG